MEVLVTNVRLFQRDHSEQKKFQQQNTSKENIYLPDTRSEISEIDTANYDKLRLMR